MFVLCPTPRQIIHIWNWYQIPGLACTYLGNVFICDRRGGRVVPTSHVFPLQKSWKFISSQNEWTHVPRAAVPVVNIKLLLFHPKYPYIRTGREHWLVRWSFYDWVGQKILQTKKWNRQMQIKPYYTDCEMECRMDGPVIHSLAVGIIVGGWYKSMRIAVLVHTGNILKRPGEQDAVSFVRS